MLVGESGAPRRHAAEAVLVKTEPRWLSDLLVEQHADEQCEGVAREQCICFGVIGEVECHAIQYRTTQTLMGGLPPPGEEVPPLADPTREAPGGPLVGRPGSVERPGSTNGFLC